MRVIIQKVRTLRGGYAESVRARTGGVGEGSCLKACMLSHLRYEYANFVICTKAPYPPPPPPLPLEIDLDIDIKPCVKYMKIQTSVI